jgi:hypothetical protein
MIGGATDGVYNLAQANIVDQFEARGISWKTYQEKYPGNCFTGDSSPYVRQGFGQNKLKFFLHHNALESASHPGAPNACSNTRAPRFRSGERPF